MLDELLFLAILALLGFLYAIYNAVKEIQKNVANLHMFDFQVITKLKLIEAELKKLTQVETPFTKEKEVKEAPIPNPIAEVVKPIVEVKVPIVEVEENIETVNPITIDPEPFLTNNVVEPISIKVEVDPIPEYESIHYLGLTDRLDNWWTIFKQRNPDLEKFIGENIISKIGILILVLGVSYFVKFAVDKNWIGEPARVGIGMFVGGLIMFIAFKLKATYKSFSTVLIAGAFTVFYLTIAIGFHDYKLFNPTVAFLLMVAITAFSTFITILFDRIELAALTLIGGFAVPFMVNTTGGNPTLLWLYIVLLDIGIIIMAYYKKWIYIQWQAYAFTQLLFNAWLLIQGDQLSPIVYSILLYAYIFHVLFMAMNILPIFYNKVVFNKSQYIIMLSSTFLFYVQALSLFSLFDINYKGAFTILLALQFLAIAYLVNSKAGQNKNLTYLLVGLVLTFVTLAIPLQFNGNYITLFYAAEAVLLLYLANKSRINEFSSASIIVFILSFISMLLDWKTYYNSSSQLQIIFNPACLSSIFIMISAILSTYLLKGKGIIEHFYFSIDCVKYRRFLQMMLIYLIYVAGFLEVYNQVKFRIDYQETANSILAIYHLLICFAFIYYLHYLKNTQLPIIQGLFSAVNIFLFLFIFSRYAYNETIANALGLSDTHMAYIFHLIMIPIIGIYVYLLYFFKSYKFIPQNYISWIASAGVLYFCSSEFLLQANHFFLGDIKYMAKGLTLNDLGIALTQEPIKSYLQNFNIMLIKSYLPILWILLVLGFLIYGIKKQIQHLRFAALALLGLTVLKLFIYDIKNISESGKIIAFILLGVFILVISFVYQRLKVLILAENLVNPNLEPNDKD